MVASSSCRSRPPGRRVPTVQPAVSVPCTDQSNPLAGASSEKGLIFT